MSMRNFELNVSNGGTVHNSTDRQRRRMEYSGGFKMNEPKNK